MNMHVVPTSAWMCVAVDVNDLPTCPGVVGIEPGVIGFTCYVSYGRCHDA